MAFPPEREIVPLPLTVIVPLSEGFTQGAPVVVTVKLKVPDAVGVPLIVNTPALNVPVTPATIILEYLLLAGLHPLLAHSIILSPHRVLLV